MNGSETVGKTLELIEKQSKPTKYKRNEDKTAYKLNKENCKIDDKISYKYHNLMEV
jgi:hypothetical protein